jgi:hypothetical protein
MGLIKTIKKKISGTAKDAYNRAYSFFKDRLPYRVKQYVEENANKRVEKLKVYRQPIQTVIDKLFNILSMSKWDDAKTKMGYDDLFHLYIILLAQNQSNITVYNLFHILEQSFLALNLYIYKY